MRSCENGDYDCGPDPKRTLERYDDIESEPRTSLERNINPIDPILRMARMSAGRQVEWCFWWKEKYTRLTPSMLPEMMAAIPPRKLPSALARTLNQTIHREHR